MNQTSIIAGSLIVAFIVFIIVRGELPCYLQVLGVSTAASCPKGTVSCSGLSGQAANALTGGNAAIANGSVAATGVYQIGCALIGGC